MYAGTDSAQTIKAFVMAIMLISSQNSGRCYQESKIYSNEDLYFGGHWCPHLVVRHHLDCLSPASSVVHTADH